MELLIVATWVEPAAADPSLLRFVLILDGMEFWLSHPTYSPLLLLK